MKRHIKTPEQVEFTDLVRELKERFGYNQNRIAAVCRLSASGVSQIISGNRSPSEARLELLRREYQELTRPEGTPAGTLHLNEEVADYGRKVAELPEGKRDVVKRLIDEMHGEVASSGLSGKDIASIAESAGRKAANEIRARRKRGAGGTSERKGEPVRDVQGNPGHGLSDGGDDPTRHGAA